MTKLPQTKGKQMARILEKYGFVARKTKGSHIAFRHPDGRGTSVPMHNKPLGVGLLRAILRQAKLPESTLWEK